MQSNLLRGTRKRLAFSHRAAFVVGCRAWRLTAGEEIGVVSKYSTFGADRNAEMLNGVNGMSDMAGTAARFHPFCPDDFRRVHFCRQKSGLNDMKISFCRTPV